MSILAKKGVSHTWLCNSQGLWTKTSGRNDGRIGRCHLCSNKKKRLPLGKQRPEVHNTYDLHPRTKTITDSTTDTQINVQRQVRCGSPERRKCCDGFQNVCGYNPPLTLDSWNQPRPEPDLHGRTSIHWRRTRCKGISSQSKRLLQANVVKITQTSQGNRAAAFKETRRLITLCMVHEQWLKWWLTFQRMYLIRMPWRLRFLQKLCTSQC